MALTRTQPRHKDCSDSTALGLSEYLCSSQDETKSLGCVTCDRWPTFTFLSKAWVDA